MAIAEYQGVTGTTDPTPWRTRARRNITVDHQVGDNTPAKCKVPVLGLELCGEAMLDIEYIKGVAGSIPLTDVFNKQYSLENWAKQLEDMPDGTLPLIHSVSYGNDESQQTGDDYIQACNVEFQLGVRGCRSHERRPRRRRPREGQALPPGLPRWLSVHHCRRRHGLRNPGRGRRGEGVVQWWRWLQRSLRHPFLPGRCRGQVQDDGGQRAAAAVLLEQYWARIPGRGGPGGQGNPYCVSVSKTLAGVAGTSASCPVVAGVFAKLNEIRLAAGKAPLGFLNPFIYQNADAFNDVTQGSNPGVQAGKGFPAVAGWDAATGVGTPNFAALAKLM